MIGRALRILAALAGLALLAPRLSAQVEAAPPSNDQVGREVDAITAPPPYDWLRRQGGGPEAGPAPVSGKGRPTPAKARPTRAERDDGCDYEPQRQDEKERVPVDLPEGEGGCGGGPPGAQQGGTGVAPAPDSSSGCGCDAPAPSCGCDRALGSCGCSGIGAALSPLGYVLGAAALALIVFFVVRAIARRERPKDAAIAIAPDRDEPEQVRISELRAAPAETMLERAAAAAAAGDYKAAVGWAYLAGIAMVHQAGFTPLDQSTTNWTIVANTRRAGGPSRAVAALVGVFEELYFGGRAPEPRHWEAARSIVEVELAGLAKPGA